MSQGNSIRRVAVELDISRSSFQQMSRKDMKAFPYKLQTVHKLKEEDNDRRVGVCETLLNYNKNNLSILNDIWFIGEAVFYLSGRVNRHNTRIWETKNPKAVLEKKRDLPKLFVWCAISPIGIIDPYFIRDDQRKNHYCYRRKLPGNA